MDSPLVSLVTTGLPASAWVILGVLAVLGYLLWRGPPQ